MLRPERMTIASVICVKQDVEQLLEALSSFGEFHIEEIENASPIEYNQEIQKAEESLTNVNDLLKQLIPEKTSMFVLSKPLEPAKIQVTADNWQVLAESTSQKISALKKEVDELNNSLSSLQEKTAQLNNVKRMLTIIDEKHGDLEAIQTLELIHVTAASVPHKNIQALKAELARFPLILSSVFLTKETSFVNIAVPSKQGADVEKIVKAHHAEVFSIPKDLPHKTKDAIKEINDRLKDSADKEKAISDSLNKLGKENKSSLRTWKETIENILALLNAKKKMLQSGRLATIKGFVPKKQYPALSEKVHGMLGDKAIVLSKEPEEGQHLPTCLRNNRFIKPFETVTNLYGLPKYGEIDPTPIMAISFPIIFGLMFGDIGDGLIVFLMGLVGFLILKKGGFKNLFWVLATCGLAGVFFGFMYGESFGHAFGAPLWFDPFYVSLAGAYPNVLRFLIFALYIGVAQITLGISIEMANYLLNRKIGDALTVALPKILFYGGSVYTITVYGLNLSAWFAGPAELFIILPFFVMVLANPVYVSLSHRFITMPVSVSTSLEMEETELDVEEHKGSFSQSLFDGGDIIIRFLSNTISYSRILALLTAHWALLLAFTQLNFLVGGGALGFLMIIVGNVLVLTLELLVVFIHTLRLHFYEWFSKFYAGTGTGFHPFKQNFVYTKVVINGKGKRA